MSYRWMCFCRYLCSWTFLRVIGHFLGGTFVLKYFQGIYLCSQCTNVTLPCILASCHPTFPGYWTFTISTCFDKNTAVVHHKLVNFIDKLPGALSRLILPRLCPCLLLPPKLDSLENNQWSTFGIIVLTKIPKITMTLPMSITTTKIGFTRKQLVEHLPHNCIDKNPKN